MEKTRLQKIIAESGICSRRKAEELIRQGCVRVNGRPAKLGDGAAPNDVVTVNGERIKIPKKREKYYLMLNKPRGYVTTMSDELDRPLVDWTGIPRGCCFLPTTESLPMISCTPAGTFPKLTA